MVGRRRNLLAYLQKKDINRYRALMLSWVCVSNFRKNGQGAFALCPIFYICVLPPPYNAAHHKNPLHLYFTAAPAAFLCSKSSTQATGLAAGFIVQNRGREALKVKIYQRRRIPMAYEFASRLETFPNYRKFETTFAGRPFVVETGKMCGLSNGSAMIRLRRDLRAVQRHQ